MKKEFISMPLPIDNVFGEVTSKAKEIIILLGVLAAVWVSWILLLLPFGVNYILPTVLSVGFFIYWLSEILGKGPDKRKFYKRQLSGDLSEEHKLVGINMIDGKDVFYGGLVVNFLIGEFRFYTDGNQLTLDFERFLDTIAPLFYNAYFVNLPVEEDFSDDASNVRVYTDRQVAQERYDYYIHQQDVIRSIKRYNVVIAIRASMDDINALHEKMETMMLSDASICFSKLQIAEGPLLSTVLGSDIGYEQDINVLLDNKYYDSASMSSLRVVDRG